MKLALTVGRVVEPSEIRGAGKFSEIGQELPILGDQSCLSQLLQPLLGIINPFGKQLCSSPCQRWFRIPSWPGSLAPPTGGRKDPSCQRSGSRRATGVVCLLVLLRGQCGDRKPCILECAGRAARANRIPLTGNTCGVCRELGRRILPTPRRRRFALATMPGWELGLDQAPEQGREGTVIGDDQTPQA